ncbi:electron transport complex, RnfABCDGE type, A subunit [Fusobacterium necrophorum subsp. funduliforme ATCC 51357]|uniref:Ion-translocating oxidoreductase complex subunit A n=2 Tax=Fusobacterium necrophorum subsp. funduliforme TaxID=143387 RepID=A0A170MXR9_9FUSO|nr:electron transport complex subunit RsxA [Fusobacterium necrophorum]AYV92188.1 electron transport complex subunit RsxA [Fusobacterium necrophorum subsp. funduliforme]EIJ69546.1 electron transport complex, RnfABCDGE type, A subunit [Fusobacterium necrophorum subsp. funduliforme ATCC 51357]EYD68589.1 Na(+)-translocating NADH-quinone reductase subunit D [Fusobacterium necrophorum subsp. funduliforme B35]KAB0552371.1 electron transport complex subunit RsxA [Fusobacterium necrophorum subsp. fundul
MSIGSIFGIIISSIFINNIIFAKFLGCCPFMGVSKKIDASLGMGMAVTFVITIASGVTWLVYWFILEPMGLAYLQTIAFILIIASLVQFVEMAIQKTSPSLYKALGVFLPLITTNCAVLGVAIINIQAEYNFIETLVNGFSVAIGFSLALILLAGVRERIEYSAIPKAFQGIPIAFLTASLLAMAFMGFSGMKI